MTRKNVLIGFVAVLAMMVLLTGMVFAQNYDFSGKTVTLVDEALDNFEEEGLYPERKAELEEKYNVVLDWVSSSDAWNTAEGKIARLMAGDSGYDIWAQINEWKYFPLLEMGGMYPLDSALKEVLGSDPYSDYIHSVEQKRNMLEHQGVNYTMYKNSNPGPPTLMYFNKDIIEEQGLPDPYELWENGEWTWSNFMTIAESATMDTNGDGEINQWGMHSRYWHLNHLNQPEIIKEVDGKYVFAAGNKLVEALELGSELISSGVRKGDNALQRFGQGEILFSMEPIWKLTNLAEDFNYGIIPGPMMPSADSHVSITVASNIFALPVNTEKPEALVALFHDLFRKGDLDSALEDLKMTYAKDPTAATVIEKAIREYPVGYNFSGYPFLGDFFYDFEGALWGSESPIEIIERVKPKAQQIIDDLLNFDSTFSN